MGVDGWLAWLDHGLGWVVGSRQWLAVLLRQLLRCQLSSVSCARSSLVALVLLSFLLTFWPGKISQYRYTRRHRNGSTKKSHWLFFIHKAVFAR
jgi:hypothetical protein